MEISLDFSILNLVNVTSTLLFWSIMLVMKILKIWLKKCVFYTNWSWKVWNHLKFFKIQQYRGIWKTIPCSDWLKDSLVGKCKILCCIWSMTELSWSQTDFGKLKTIAPNQERFWFINNCNYFGDYIWLQSKSLKVQHLNRKLDDFIWGGECGQYDAEALDLKTRLHSIAGYHSRSAIRNSSFTAL